LHTRTACVFRFSQPRDAFIRPEPAGLISCRIRSWGHPPELCSSRAAVRCFQRQSPHDVFTPSGFCSTRESATRTGGLDQIRARSSPGPFPLQGFLSPGDGAAFTVPSLMRLTLSNASVPSGSTPGHRSPEDGLVSFETAYPPGVSGLLIDHVRSNIRGFWSHLLSSPGCVTVPLSALL